MLHESSPNPLATNLRSTDHVFDDREWLCGVREILTDMNRVRSKKVSIPHGGEYLPTLLSNPR